jgi:hypothetical protein
MATRRQVWLGAGLACALWVAALVASASAGVVRTLDGRELAGEIRWVEGNIRVGEATVALDEVLELRATESAEPALSRGVVLVDGTAVAAEAILRADGETVTLRHRARGEMTIGLGEVSALVAAVGEARWRDSPGVVLQNGDFVSGAFRGLDDGGRVRVSSPVFGLSRFELDRQVRAVLLRPVEPARQAYSMQLQDGTKLTSDVVRQEGAVLMIEDARLGAWRVPGREVVWLRHAGDRVAALGTAGVVRVRTGEELIVEIDDTYVQVSGRVRVEARALPMVRARLVVLEGERVLWESPWLTSVDEPVEFITPTGGQSAKMRFRAETEDPAGVTVIVESGVLVRE